MVILRLCAVGLQLGGTPILNSLTMDSWEGHTHALIAPKRTGVTIPLATLMREPVVHDD